MKICRRHICGSLPLKGRPNPIELEKGQTFTADLFFVEIQDGTHEQLMVELERIAKPGEPRTRARLYNDDGNFFAVVYERTQENYDEAGHTSALGQAAEQYCAKSSHERRIVEAEALFKRSSKLFENIVKKTLGLKVSV